MSETVTEIPARGGNLTSGGMMANFIGMKLARDWASRDQIQQEGVRERWAVYASDQRHVSVDKAVDAVGLGRTALRALPTDAEFRVRIDIRDASRDSCPSRLNHGPHFVGATTDHKDKNTVRVDVCWNGGGIVPVLIRFSMSNFVTSFHSCIIDQKHRNHDA